MESIETLNSRLAQYYGTDIVTNLPKFRLVWSDDQLEQRYGEFEDWYGNIFIRRYSGVKTVQKYPWIKQRWVLEQFAPNPHSEIKSLHTYEPRWQFSDSQGRAVPPIWRALEVIIHAIMNPSKLSPSDMISQDEKEMQKETEMYEQYFGDKFSKYGLAIGEAVTVPDMEKVKNG